MNRYFKFFFLSLYFILFQQNIFAKEIYGKAFSYMSKKYKTAENEAKKVSAGAWAGEFIFPWEWRKIKKK